MERRDIPNLITVTRILLVAPIAATLADRHYVWALALIAVAGLSDGLDGFLARRYDWRSRLGALLDPLADKLLLTVSFLVLGWLGVVPLWLVAAVIGRDLLIVGGALAYHRRVGRLEMAPSRWSKINTALLLGYLLAVVAGQELGGALARWSPLLVWPVLATTVVSGLDYVIHWSARARKEARR